MNILVIVESPTKAKTISKFLGKKYTVTSSFGHVRDLPKSKMGIDIEGGTFEPTYEVPATKKKQVTELKKLAKVADEIIFATDEDREGEAISWHLAHILKIDPAKAKRIAFHEITKSAIEEALEHPRTLDQHLVDAQQARRVLDRLVGYELSPFLWKKVARGLSAGRVQSVTVRLVVERERERDAFQSVEYWSLMAELETAEKAGFTSLLTSIDGKRVGKLEISSKGMVDDIVKDLDGATYVVEKIEKKQTKRTPPPPFTTSTLQQAANNKFGYSSKYSMKIAQELYEGVKIGSNSHTGLITYMRTDSLNLSDKFITEATEMVKKEYGADYVLEKPRRYKTKSKGAQEAHEAIRPTDPTRTPESLKDVLSDQQLKVYSIIWKRAVATQMAEAVLWSTKIDISAGKYGFRTNGKTVKFLGWLALYPQRQKEDLLPELKEKDVLDLKELVPEEHHTEPPARYSDATLVKTLEEYGIGRPSTYAPTISTVEARGYVERDDNKRLKPMDIAYLVNDLLVEHFSQIVDYKFTAQMEENLDDIAEGTKDWQPIISTFYHPFHENLMEKTDSLTKQELASMTELGVNPANGKKVFVRIGRYGPFIQNGESTDEDKPTFGSVPKGVELADITYEMAMLYLSLPRTLGQDKDGIDVTADVGRFGPYVKVASKYYSLKEDNPYDITLERALEIVAEKNDADAKAVLKTFEGSDIIVKVGRYGPYITNGKTNAKIPKDVEPKDLDLKKCEELIEEAKTKPKRKWAKKKKKGE